MKYCRKIVGNLLIGILLFFYVQVPPYATALINENAKGYIDNPVFGATLNGTKEVSGWFLDVSGVAKVEVLVDGIVAGEAAYGETRHDVQIAFPEFNNGNAGFRFSLDTTQFSDGQHTVTVRETGMNGQVTTLPSHTVTIANANTKGYLDNPVSDAILTGTKKVSGWFLDAIGVAKIEVLVNGVVAGQAIYGGERPDVQKALPEYNNKNAGFHFDLDTTKYSDGRHSVTIRETGKNGRTITMPASTVTFANDITKGYLDTPLSGASLSGVKNLSGWYLDGYGVAKIEVLVDGSVVGHAAYGGERPDVQKAFPEFNNKNAGFHYDLDTTKFSDGQHTVTIRETGTNGRVTLLPEVSVSFANVKGYVDNPVSSAELTGIKNVSGWFLDGSGVAKVEVLVDGSVVGEAAYGDARLDVQTAFPDFNNGKAGFHYALDTTKFSEGQHTVTIRGTGKNGRVTILSDVPVTFANVKGYLDSPVSGTLLSGIKNVSGWFLDITGVAKIEVLVDGMVVGEAAYGDARPDLQMVFPDFNNGMAGFHYALDTTKFPEGQHTVTIRETGTNGLVTTLPVSTVTFRQSKKVFLDPGHGGSDPGATAGVYHEADLNLAVAKKVQSLLLNRGYEVYMSRNNNTYVGLLDRPQMANNLPADIFVSIHTNSTGGGATTASGIESYFYEYDPNYPSKINEPMHNNPERILKSVTLTNIIQDNMISYTGANNRGTDGETFAVIREAAMPATLLEMGFINNSSDRQKLFTDSYQNQLAQAIADGIHEYFRIY
jgi:N-acetylmuramoyl-L-alanine amidase